MNILKTTIALTSILALSSCGAIASVEKAIAGAIDAADAAANRTRSPVVNTDGGKETTSSAAFVEKSVSDDTDGDDTDGDDTDGDDTDGDVAVDVSDFSDFENFDDAGEEYQDRITSLYKGIDSLSSIAFSDPSTLPTSGGATYDGVMSLEQIIGEMTLTADFVDDTISGSVTDFIDVDDSPILGTLTISSTSADGIDRTVDTGTDYTFAADLTGELSDEEGAYTLVGEILGDFTGSDQEYVEGSVIGTATHTTDADDVVEFSGHFVGAQD